MKPRVHVKPQKKMCQHHSTAFKCWRCGGEHSVVNCKHANSTCRYCSKQGHIEKACFKKKKDTERKHGKEVDFLHEDDRHDEHNYEPVLHVNSV